MTPTFAVVIPAYESSQTIEACLRSVADQTLAPSEVLVVDDHSSDDTPRVVAGCRELLARRGTELRLIEQAVNAGPSAARNVGIDQAKASHVAFLDADDVWHERKLEVARTHLEAAPGTTMLFHSYTDRAVFGEAVAGPSAYRAVPVRIWKLLFRNPAQTSCVVLRRDRMYRFDEGTRRCEDYELWLRIAESHAVLRLVGPALTRLGRPQLSPGGLSGSRHRMRLAEMSAYLSFCSRRWFPRLALLPLLLALSLLKHGRSALRRTPRRMDPPA